MKNEYTGINFIDTYFRKGGPAYTQALPFVSGQEGGGTSPYAATSTWPLIHPYHPVAAR